jgi:hypothetical protein
MTRLRQSKTGCRPTTVMIPICLEESTSEFFGIVPENSGVSGFVPLLRAPDLLTSL